MNQKKKKKKVYLLNRKKSGGKENIEFSSEKIVTKVLYIDYNQV